MKKREKEKKDLNEKRMTKGLKKTIKKWKKKARMKWKRMNESEKS